ncbi:MAG: EAL domain-containing protein, partial [Caldimonas sp.]
SLGLRVIAEGVENLRQMEVLHRLGCGIMQGFLFSKAQPPEDIELWLKQTVLPKKAPWIGQASSGDNPDSVRPKARESRVAPIGKIPLA